MFNFIVKLLITFHVVRTNAQTTWNPFEQKLHSLLEMWKSGTSNILPALDPMQLPPVEASYELSVIRIDFAFQNVRLSGLNTFSLSELNASYEDLHVHLRIKVPSITLIAEQYTLDGRAFIFIPIKCSGAMEVNLYDTEMTATVQLSYNGTSTAVGYAALKLNPGDFKANFMDCTSANLIIRTIGKRLLEENLEYISSSLREKFILLADDFLRSLSPEQLLDSLDVVINGP